MASIIKANQLQDFGGNSIITSDGAGNLTTQKINYPAFEAYLNADTNISDATYTTVNIDTEVFDTDNAFDTSTYTFTPQVAGKYFVYGSIRFQCSVANTITTIVTRLDLNGSTYKNTNFDPNSNENIVDGHISAIIDLNGSSDYVTFTGYADVTSGTPRFDSGTKSTYFGAYRIGS